MTAEIEKEQRAYFARIGKSRVSKGGTQETIGQHPQTT